GHRHDLLRRDVHEVDLFTRDVVDLAGGAVARGGRAHPHAGALRATADEHAVVGELAVGLQGGVGLGDDVFLFLVGGEVDDLVGDLALHDLAVGRLDEAVLVDAAVGGQVALEADVRAFRRLDGAHAAVVRGVHVTDLEPRALARQAAGAERREAALV